jgi:hypothetical protein
MLGTSRSLPAIAWDAANAAAKRTGLDAALVRAIVWHESRGNPMAVSSSGARGLMQLLPFTGESYGLHDPFGALPNALAGCRFYADLLLRYSVHADAIAAFQWGPGNVDRVRRREIEMPAHVTDGVLSVLQRAEVERRFTGPFRDPVAPCMASRPPPLAASGGFAERVRRRWSRKPKDGSR